MEFKPQTEAHKTMADPGSVGFDCGIQSISKKHIVPNLGPLFIPTATPTRDPRAYSAEAEALAKEGKVNLAIDAYKNSHSG